MKKKVALYSLCILSPISADTMWFVYNMRMAATTRQEEDAIYHSLASGLVANIDRQHYNGAHTAVSGGLATYIHTEPAWYARLDFAAANVRGKAKDYSVSSVQTDDILLSGGYCIATDDHTKFTFSGMIGLPTHNDHGLFFPQFGTGHAALGAQVDGIFKLPQLPTHSIQAAVRIVHFFPRTRCVSHRFETARLTVHFGNLFDLFAAYVCRLGSKKSHVLEAGYNPQFIFGSNVSPHVSNFPTSVNYIRHIFYTSWTCGFSIESERPHAVSFGFSYAFDSKPKTVGNKRITVAWTSWGINF